MPKQSENIVETKLTSFEYLPYSTIPPNIINRVPSETKPYAAQPGGMSPRTAGTNHWLVAETKKLLDAQF